MKSIALHPAFFYEGMSDQGCNTKLLLTRTLLKKSHIYIFTQQLLSNSLNDSGLMDSLLIDKYVILRDYSERNLFNSHGIIEFRLK